MLLRLLLVCVLAALPGDSFYITSWSAPARTSIRPDHASAVVAARATGISSARHRPRHHQGYPGVHHPEVLSGAASDQEEDVLVGGSTAGQGVAPAEGTQRHGLFEGFLGHAQQVLAAIEHDASAYAMMKVSCPRLISLSGFGHKGYQNTWFPAAIWLDKGRSPEFGRKAELILYHSRRIW